MKLTQTYQSVSTFLLCQQIFISLNKINFHPFPNPQQPHIYKILFDTLKKDVIVVCIISLMSSVIRIYIRIQISATIFILQILDLLKHISRIYFESIFHQCICKCILKILMKSRDWAAALTN